MCGSVTTFTLNTSTDRDPSGVKVVTKKRLDLPGELWSLSVNGNTCWRSLGKWQGIAFVMLDIVQNGVGMWSECSIPVFSILV